MGNYMMILIVVFGVAACAGAASRNNAPEPVHEAAAGAGESTADEDEIQVAEIPTVPRAAAVVDRGDRVCSNERKTGTNRVERVCRTRAEIEQQRVESKEVFDDLHRSQQEY